MLLCRLSCSTFGQAFRRKTGVDSLNPEWFDDIDVTCQGSGQWSPTNMDYPCECKLLNRHLLSVESFFCTGKHCLNPPAPPAVHKLSVSNYNNETPPLHNEIVNFFCNTTAVPGKV